MGIYWRHSHWRDEGVRTLPCARTSRRRATLSALCHCSRHTRPLPPLPGRRRLACPAVQLVGAAFVEFGVAVPLIAVTPLGCVKGRAAFDGPSRRSLTATYSCQEKADATGACLDPHHTHFVLVDNGKTAPAAWGAEIGLRTALEATYASQKAVPIVLVVLQGGPGTLGMVLAYARNGQAILLVRGSGGAADAVASYLATGATADAKFQGEQIQESLAEICALQTASDGSLISTFALDGDVEMSTMLLKALIRNLRVREHALSARADVGGAGAGVLAVAATDVEARSSLHASRRSVDGSFSSSSMRKESRHEEVLARALVLAVNWNRVDIAEGLLHDMSSAAAAAGDAAAAAAGGALERPHSKFTYGHHVALQFMIEKQRVELFRLIAGCPDFTVRGVNLARLYQLAEDKYSILRADAELQQRMKERLKEISETARGGDSGEPANSYALFKEVVGPFLSSYVPELGPVLYASDETGYRDLFLWSVVIGDDAFMFEFWKMAASPIRLALLGARLARTMTLRMPFGKLECHERAELLESWAVGALTSMPTQLSAHRILSRRLPEWGASTLLDSAMQFEMKSFLAQKQCQSLMDAWWRGDFPGGQIRLPEDYSGLGLWCYVLLPPCNPYLYRASEAAAKEDALIKDMKGFAGALMHAHRLSRKEANAAMSTDAAGSLGDALAGLTTAAASASAAASRFDGLLSEHLRQEELATAHALDAAALSPRRREANNDPSRGWHGSSRRLWARIVGFYSVPATKLMVRFMVHMVMLAAHATVLFLVQPVDHVDQNGVPPVNWHEGLFFCLVVAQILDQAHQSMVLRRRHVVLTQPFRRLLEVGDAVLLLAGLLRAATVPSLLPELLKKRLYNAYQLVVSLDVIVVSMRTVAFRSTDMSFGVLVIMVEQMIGDLILFVELFALVSFGFMLAFVGLIPWSPEKWEYDDPDGIQPLASPGVLDAPTGRELRGDLGESPNIKRGPWHALSLLLWGVFGEFVRGRRAPKRAASYRVVSRRIASHRVASGRIASQCEPRASRRIASQCEPGASRRSCEQRVAPCVLRACPTPPYACPGACAARSWAFTRSTYRLAPQSSSSTSRSRPSSSSTFWWPCLRTRMPPSRRAPRPSFDSRRCVPPLLTSGAARGSRGLCAHPACVLGCTRPICPERSPPPLPPSPHAHHMHAHSIIASASVLESPSFAV